MAKEVLPAEVLNVWVKRVWGLWAQMLKQDCAPRQSAAGKRHRVLVHAYVPVAGQAEQRFVVDGLRRPFGPREGGSVCQHVVVGERRRGW